jgi:sugar lactone lactonase YvrE
LALAGLAEAAPAVNLELVAESERRWTGVAVSRQGRTFVNFPRWSAEVPVSVAEWVEGELQPYPSEEWNRWSPEIDPGERFVCVQSVTVDDEGFLWVLDPANPWMQGVIEGGPKLVKIDLERDEVVRVFRFDSKVAPSGSYLNDLRVDTATGTVYLTDSGTGALVVLDEATGGSRRVLAAHPSTLAEEIRITIGGRGWVTPDGSTPRVHADGIALSPDRRYLYYQALTGRSLYRVPTEALRDSERSPEELGQLVEKVAESGVADGIAFGPGGHLYLSALEDNAINRLTPEGKVETVVRDSRISWPDSFAVPADGSIYFTTAQIHLGADPPEPFRLWRLTDLP